MATTLGATVSWNSTPIGDYVNSANLDITLNTADCSGLGDEWQDNRGGNKSISASVTILLKDSNTVPMGVGDSGTLAVGGLTGTVLVTGISQPLEINAALVQTVSFVSTKAAGT